MNDHQRRDVEIDLCRKWRDQGLIVIERSERDALAAEVVRLKAYADLVYDRHMFAEAENARLREGLERIAVLHGRSVESEGRVEWCAHCGQGWPCPSHTEARSLLATPTEDVGTDG